MRRRISGTKGDRIAILVGEAIGVKTVRVSQAGLGNVGVLDGPDMGAGALHAYNPKMIVSA